MAHHLRRFLVAITAVAFLLGFTHQVQAECPSFLLTWGSEASGVGQTSRPAGIAVDVDGYVYVICQASNTIQKFTSLGMPVMQWSCGPNVFPGPFGLALGPDGLLYATHSGTNSVLKFTRTGGSAGGWSSTGSGPGQMDHPSGIAVDALGNVFVSDTFNHRVQKFSSGGTFLAQWNSVPSSTSFLSSPSGIAVDAVGDVFVCDAGNHRVVKYDGNGNFITQWYGSSAGTYFTQQPVGIAIGPDGHVFTTETGSWQRVQEFTGTGEYLCMIGIPGGGRAIGQFDSPVAAAASSDGSLFVVDRSNSRIEKFGYMPTPAAPSTWGRVKVLMR